MDKAKALQKLLNGTATEEEIELLRNALANGEISIGGDVNRSVVIIGSGNKVELTAEALGILKPESQTEEPAAGEPPYMGLRYFDVSNVDLFYGRESLTRELLARVQKESFLAIVGASGSGKSSVARAGLIPAWKQENERSAIHVITPTAHPLESLAASLTRDSESVTATSTLIDDLMKDTRSLRLYVRKTLRETKLLLLVDQFEETFTLCKDSAERKAFIENLLSLTDDDAQGAVRVVVTLRADFYHHCAEYEGLRNAFKSHQEYIGAMTADELRQAITTPAEKNGWDFQPGLVDLILSDVGAEPGALPLLSHALLETWKRRQGRTLTLQGYHEAGGVKKAIAQTAEGVYDRLTPAEQAIARGIFLRLTELGEGVQDTRRRVKLDELSRSAARHDVIEKVLMTLTDARLVTTEQDSVEATHEALIREWGTLRKWLEEDRENLRLHRHLTESALEWKRRGRDKGDVYRGTRLSQMRDWVKSNSDQLNQLEQDFLNASFSQNKQERYASRFLKIVLVSTSIISLTTFVFIVLSVNSININQYIIKPINMDNYWVVIPGGKFQMGSEDGYYDERPIQTFNLKEFQIGRFEITNQQYYQCVKAGICLAPLNREYFIPERGLYSITDVTWYDAMTYCSWVGGRLPSEAEWEKAARGIDGSTYPWGEGIDCNKANYKSDVESCEGKATVVGSYPDGVSPYGLYDMAGNVWELVSTLYMSYPYYSTDGREDLMRAGARVMRGGSWNDFDFSVRPSFRFNFDPHRSSNLVGFRCARSLP